MALGIKTDLINNPDPNKDKLNAGDIAKDLALAPVRGAEGAAKSVYNLADWALGDALPDYNNRFLGQSQTIGGSLVEGVTQFLLPFGALAKGATAVSKLGAASKLGRAAKPFTTVNKKGKTKLNWKGVLAAESASDFVAFEAHEQRLSNLIQTHPNLKNPISEFLAAKDTDGELEGRFKNTLEGLGLTGVAGSLIQAVKLVKLNRQDRAGTLGDGQKPKATKQQVDQSAYRSVFGENATYDVYSPSLRAVDKVQRKSIPPKNIIQELSRTGERGVAEELKWMGLDNPEFLPLNAKGQVDVPLLKEYIEDAQLQTVIVEQRPDRVYRQYKQKGGTNYREFTVETTSHANRVEKEKLGYLTSYNPHYDQVARREGRENLIHFRTTERTLDDGKQILQIEELQSDFIQTVKKERRTGELQKQAPDQYKAPLEESYIASAMRQIVQMAAKEGYDAVSFPRGSDVADLYNETLDNIKINAINEDGSKSLRVTKNDKTEDFVVKDKKELESYVGKSAADELDTKPEGWEADKYIVGSKPAPFIQQYDAKMPAALKRLGASFGTKSRIEKLKTLNKSEPVDKQTVLDPFTERLITSGREEQYFAYDLDSIAFHDTVKPYQVVMKAGNIRMDMEELLDTLRRDQGDVDGVRYGEDPTTDQQIDEVISKYLLSPKFDKDYQFIRGEFDEGNKIFQEAHIIDINKDMAESVSKGVSLWGQKSLNNSFGGQINDPLLKDRLGFAEADSLPIVQAMARERKAEAGNLLDPLNDKSIDNKYAAGRLAENGSTPEVRRAFKALLKLHEGDEAWEKTDIQVFLSNQQAGDFNPLNPQTGRGSIQLYTAKTGVFNNTVDPNQVFSEATLFHEMVHAGITTKIPVEISAVNQSLKGEDYLSTVAAVADDTAQAEPLRKILRSYLKAVDNAPEQFKSIRDSLNDVDGYLKAGNETTVNEWYGLSNVDEFVAESLSNPVFQNYLKGIQGEGGNNTLFDEILEFISDLLGLEGKGTVLEDVVTAYSDLATKHKKRFRAIDYTPEGVSRMFPTRSSFAFRQIREKKKVDNIKGRLGEIEIDFTNPDVGKGGTQAVQGVGSALRQVETANDLSEVIGETERLVEQNLQASPKLSPANLEAGGIAAAVRRFSELTGQDKDFILSEVEQAGKDANELRRIAARMYTVESLAMGQADEVFKLATSIREKGTAVTDVDKAQMAGELKKLVSIAAAGSNLRRGFGQGLQSTQFKRSKLTLNELELREKEIVSEFMANNIGEKNFDLFINRLLVAGGKENPVEKMLGLVRYGKSADPNGYIEKAQNWFVNSLLSGPRTMMKNGIGNAVTQALLQVELGVGGAIRGNEHIVRHAMKEFFTLESMREGMDFFLRAYKLDEQLLDVGRSPLENTMKTERPQYFTNASPEQTMKTAFNWFGDNVVNIPTKLLMSMDEVFKQSLFRQNTKLELTLKAIKLGIKNPDEISEYVADGLDQILVNGERAFSNTGIIKFAQETVAKEEAALLEAGGKALLPSERGQKLEAIIKAETESRGKALGSIEEGGLGFESLGELEAMAERGLEQARYGTFTNDAGKAAELAGAIVKTVPLLKLIFPFVRTPINLLKFSFDRASFGSMEIGRQVLGNMPEMPMLRSIQQDFKRQLSSRNEIEKARAVGKLATSAMINATLLYMIASNREYITSGGPKNYNQTKTLEQTGWQRYAFRFGDKYASYSGLDPIGTQIGLLADMVEQMDEYGDGINQTAMESMFAAVTISMTRNITDKSYLAGLQLLSDAVSDPDSKMEKLVNNIAGGFVPNFLYQGQSVVGDTTLREVRNLGDAFLKKLPNGNDKLDPKRNLLGEPIIAEQIPFVGPFNPSRISTRKGDSVFEELAQLDHGFTMPRTKLAKLIDLLDYSNDKGQTAYDRQLELLGNIKIKGKSLRQELERVIKNQRYQKLSTFSEGGVKSPRVAVINRVLSRYRTAAFGQMLEEFPELQQKYLQIRKAKVVGKAGASEDVLTNLLNLQ